MRKTIALCLGAALILMVAMASGQKDEFDDEERIQHEQWEVNAKEGKSLFLEAEQEWGRMLREQQESWEQMVVEVNRLRVQLGTKRH